MSEFQRHDSLPQIHKESFHTIEEFHDLRATITSLQSVILNPSQPVIIPSYEQDREARNVVLSSMPDLQRLRLIIPQTPEEVTIEKAQDILYLVREPLRHHHPYTYRHTYQVADYAYIIGQEMGITDQDELLSLYWSGLMHDIGKLSLPTHLLNKPGRLDKAETDITREHPAEGGKLLTSIIWKLEDVLGGKQTAEGEKTRRFLKDIRQAVRYHHQTWDGQNGYPEPIMADAIPFRARVVTAADVIDAMRSDRIYRENGLNGHNYRLPEDVAEEFKEKSGRMFDPAIAEAVHRLFSTNSYERREELDKMMFNWHPTLRIARDQSSPSTNE